MAKKGTNAVTEVKGVMVRIDVPTIKWELLEETLRMDAEAKNFDVELRNRISSALNSVKRVPATRKKKTVSLVVPEDHWLLIEETLRIDSRSPAFDAKLKADIRDALSSIREL